MPEATNGARYACQKCVNGHRTKTCQHWENEHDKLAKALDISEVAPGASLQDIAVFAKTRSAGRPKAADLEKEKKGMTLYILLKTTVDGKESCKAVGEIDIDADGNTKETRKTCCSGGRTTPSPPANHPRTKSVSNGTPSKKRSLDTEIGDISYETTRKNAKHDCSCGSTCKCRFCPQHPNTKATQDVMRQVAAKVKEERMSKPDGQIEFHQTISDVVPCGGGQMTGANSQIFATNDLDQLDVWRQQDDGTGNFFAEIPLDLSNFSPVAVESPQHLQFPTISTPPQPVGGFHDGFGQMDDFKLPLGHGSPTSIEQYLSITSSANNLTNAPTPATSSITSTALNGPSQMQPMYHLQQSLDGAQKAGSCCDSAAQLTVQSAVTQNVVGNPNFQLVAAPNLSVFGHVHESGLIPFPSQVFMQQPAVTGQIPLPSQTVQSAQRSCCGSCAQQNHFKPVAYGTCQCGQTSVFSPQPPVSNFSPPAPHPGMLARHNSFPIYNPQSIPHISPHDHVGPDFFVSPHLGQQAIFNIPEPENFNNQIWS